MVQLSELAKEVRDDPIFQRYEQLLDIDFAILQIGESSADKAPILKDCRDMLQRMAFTFNKESPCEFTENTIQAFEWLFINFIHSIVIDPDLPDNIIRGNLKEVKKHLFTAKQSFSLALEALDRISSDKGTRFDLYNNLNDCTISFENALGHWEPKEAYNNLFSPDQRKMTASECRLKLLDINKYFSLSSPHGMKAGFLQYEEFLRKNIILNILDATYEDISSKELVLPPLRKAKIYLNLAIDEEKIKPQPQQESKKRLFKFFGECEQCLNEALTLWRDA